MLKMNYIDASIKDLSMVSFKKILEEKEKSHAYVLGYKEHQKHLLELPPKLLLSPFEPESTEDIEWFNGYYDSLFLRRLTLD